ncbi:hypothetical protein DXK94_13550 [Arthrobacter sp. RT-1]|uniref:hypothetical protein n=1 Tax=Arthrobacter sp. RT-1 TaxID=2292263 RepID=UPI000E1E56B5|nr:hypothetical protein [Arthrobacter sp. RT-1]RDV09407.1 hypothetical protein DXK94_13550 [Arthrobacter sp. RT-1]
MPAQPPLRFLRSGVITGSGIGLAAAAHTAGGGHLPPAPVLLLLAVLVMAPVMLLSRRRFRLPIMALILGGSQAALHSAFTALSGPSVHCAGPGVAAHGHHRQIAIPSCAGAPASAMELTGHALAALPAPAMLAAHLLAIAATAVVLARGEAALWQLKAWLAPLAAILHPVPLPAAYRVCALPKKAVMKRHLAVRIPPRRGPPAASGRTLSAIGAPA